MLNEICLSYKYFILTGASKRLTGDKTAESESTLFFYPSHDVIGRKFEEQALYCIISIVVIKECDVINFSPCQRSITFVLLDGRELKYYTVLI